MAETSGTCAYCGASVRKRMMLKHLAACVANQSDGPDSLIQLRVESPGKPEYWMDLEVKVHAPLARLDTTLRDYWLECCGHLSMFQIGVLEYVVDTPERGEKSMSVPCGRAIGSETEFTYEYDYGSTTELSFRVIAFRKGERRKDLVRIVTRNHPPVFICDECNRPATRICSACYGESIACEQHAVEHDPCDEDFSWGPIPNSPRAGVCAYPYV